MNNINIKATMSTRGWKDIEKIFWEETDKIMNIDTAKPMDEIGKEYIARQAAKEIIKNTFNRLYAIKNAVKKEHQKYI